MSEGSLRDREIVVGVRELRAGYYGESVLFDVSIDALPGRITAIFGHNGAGKSTLLKAIAGLNAPYGGTVCLNGRAVTGDSTRRLLKSGIMYLPQDQATFPNMSVAENLELGAIDIRGRARAERQRRVMALFPILEERLGAPARTLSGGQQRMLSVGIALMADARVLLLDEPSLGLAPAINQSLLTTIAGLAAEGRTIVLVEQAIGQALPFCDRVYVLQSGTIVQDMDRAEAMMQEDWAAVF